MYVPVAPTYRISHNIYIYISYLSFVYVNFDDFKLADIRHIPVILEV